MIDGGTGGGLWRDQKDVAISLLSILKENVRKTFYVVHLPAYVQCDKRKPTYAQRFRLFLIPQHVSAYSYIIIRGYCYKLRKMCIKILRWQIQFKMFKNFHKIPVLVCCNVVNF
jgi:hypothetical protein